MWSCVYRCCVYRKVCSACVALRTYSFNGLFRAPVFAVFECGAKVTISGGRTGELNFAIFQSALSLGAPYCPRCAAWTRRISATKAQHIAHGTNQPKAAAALEAAVDILSLERIAPRLVAAFAKAP